MRSFALIIPLAVAIAPGCRKSANEEDKRPAAAPPSAAKAAAPSPAAGLERARELAKKYIIVDGHVDLPYRLKNGEAKEGELAEDISVRTEKGDFDYFRAKAGGLDAPFMSIYIPSELQKKGGAAELADELIDMVELITKKWPEKFALATNPDEIRSNFEKGLISLPMGMENGAPLGEDIAQVKHFYDRGIRYISLTHAKDNQICDSSYDTTGTWNGLSPFGHKVVEEMNRLGIMVDVSHISDKAFYQVLSVTKVPVIASHSSARHFTVDFERNISDEAIAAMKENGGVIMVNFGSTFVSDESRKYFDRMRSAMMAQSWRQRIDRDHPKMKEFQKEWAKKHPPVFATVSDVADHIDHMVKIAGTDHVGFGSDFDGVGDSLPVGLKDASAYPNLIRELLARGYSEEDIYKFASGNVFRVWNEVRRYAAGQGGQPAEN